MNNPTLRRLLLSAAALTLVCLAVGRHIAASAQSTPVALYLPSVLKGLHFPMDYGPYRAGQSPGGMAPSPGEIAQDMALISRETNLIRTYAACSESGSIPAIAAASVVSLYQGMVLTSRPDLLL